MHADSSRRRLPATLTQCAAALGLAALALTAQAFDAPPDPDFKGRQFTIMRLPVVAGGTAPLGGQGFRAGQTITIRHGDAIVNAEGPITVDETGRFLGRIRIPDTALPGIHHVVVTTSEPVASAIFTVQVSPQVPVSGESQYDIVRTKLPPGPYQAAYSKRHDRIFVTTAQGRPPVTGSALLALDPDTLRTVASVTPPPVPGRDDGSVLAVFGLALDDQHDRVWTGNVRAGTVSVYRQADLALVKHFEPGMLKHPRDILVASGLGKVYVSDMGTAAVEVFDSQAMTRRGRIDIPVDGPTAFVPTGLALDEARARLYVAGLRNQAIAVIDVQRDEVERVVPIPGARGLMGLAFDPAQRLLFIASQNSDNLTILEVDTGHVRAQVPTGANPLSVAFNPADGLAYVANRASATVTVVDRQGRLVANLPGSSYNNHVSIDGQGRVVVINKKTEANEADGDQISRLARRPR